MKGLLDFFAQLLGTTGHHNAVLVVVAQIFGLITICLSFMSTKSETRNKIFFYNSVANITAAIQYALLGAWSGSLCSILAMCRNFVFKRYDKVPIHILIIYLLILVLFNVPTVHGFISFIPVLNVILYSYALSQDNVVTIKLIGLFTCFTTIGYDIINWAFVGVLSATFEAIVTLFVLSNLYKKYKAGLEKEARKKEKIPSGEKELVTA